MNKSMYAQLKSFLLSSKGDWQSIAKACDVDSTWPGKVMRGQIKDPGVIKTERVLRYAKSIGWKPAKTASQPQGQKVA